MEKAILGHIDCPCCGTVKGMRFTQDKNGAPFGYCEASCRVQMRIGGDAYRVKKFLEKHSWAAGTPVTVTESTPAPKPAEKPVTVTEPKPAPAPAPKPIQKPVTVTEPAPVKKGGDWLSILGGK